MDEIVLLGNLIKIKNKKIYLFIKRIRFVKKVNYYN